MWVTYLLQLWAFCFYETIQSFSLLIGLKSTIFYHIRVCLLCLIEIMEAEKREAQICTFLTLTQWPASLPSEAGWDTGCRNKNTSKEGVCAWEITRGTWSLELILVTVKVKVCLTEQSYDDMQNAQLERFQRNHTKTCMTLTIRLCVLRDVISNPS